ncbi:MAG: shikimate dehydrogenase [Pseudomonadota bacterium]
MIKAGVIGHPVAHSLSPLIHNHWCVQQDIAGQYERFDIAPDHLENAVQELVAKGLAGFNVTIPHKQAIMALCTHVDARAKKAGAVNTIVIAKDKTLSGFNTDVIGFRDNLKAHAAFAQRKRTSAIILGAGGTARAAILALQELGFTHITIVNRTVERAQALADQFTCHAQEYDHIEKISHNCDCLVNTTALGMHREMLPISLASFPPHCLVTDCVYTPLMTPLLLDAQTRGLAIQDGLGMLLYQAVDGFCAWFDPKERPVVDAGLRAILCRALGVV